MDADLIIQEHIENSLGRPFCLGIDDCATWASDLIKDLTGDDLLSKGPPVVGEKESKRAIVHVARACRKAEWVLCQPGDAPAGAVGLVRLPESHAIVVANGHGWYIGKTDRGVGFHSANEVFWSCRQS